MPNQISYSSIFRVKLTHAYFRDGIARDLSLELSSDTSKQLQSLGIVMKERAGEWHFFSQEGLKDKLQAIEDSRFVFYLTNKNPLFMNYTDIPLTFNPFKNQDILFLHNAKRVGKLQEGKKVSAKDLGNFWGDRIPVIVNQDPVEKVKGALYISKKETEFFAIDIVDGVTDKVLWTEKFYRFEDPEEEDERVYIADEKELKRTSIKKGAQVFELNLENAPEGKYKINVDGKEAMSFCLLRETMRPPLGMVTIFVKDLLEQMDATKPEPVYELAFDTRATIWKYFFLSESETLAIENVSVAKKATGLQGGTNGSDPKTFKQVKDIDEADKRAFEGKTLNLLMSNEAIPLKEDQEYKFEYTVKAKKITDQSPLDFRGDLPAANPSQLLVKKEEGSADVLLYSEVYVYL